MGRPPDVEKAVEILPFEATLAFAFRGSGGKVTALNAARLIEDQDERFKRLIYAWDHLSEKDQQAVRLEDLCAAADLTPDTFLAFVVPALWRRNSDTSRIIAAIAHPKIVEATIDNAINNGSFGSGDRRMLLEASGFLPTKQGSTINIDASRKTLVAGGQTQAIDDGPGLPSFSADIEEFGGVIRGKETLLLEEGGRRLLPPATQSQAVTASFVPEDEIVQSDEE